MLEVSSYLGAFDTYYDSFGNSQWGSTDGSGNFTFDGDVTFDGSDFTFANSADSNLRTAADLRKNFSETSIVILDYTIPASRCGEVVHVSAPCTLSLDAGLDIGWNIEILPVDAGCTLDLVSATDTLNGTTDGSATITQSYDRIKVVCYAAGKFSATSAGAITVV